MTGIKFKSVSERRIYSLVWIGTNDLRTEGGIVKPGGKFDASPGWLRGANASLFVLVEDYVEAVMKATNSELEAHASRLGRLNGTRVLTREGLLEQLLYDVNGYEASEPYEPEDAPGVVAIGDEAGEDPFGLREMTRGELRELARDMGVSVSGSKADIVARIEAVEVGE